MGSVVALDQYRELLGKNKEKRVRPPRPKISGGEVWGRDYRETEAVVYALLTVRAMAAHHSGGHDHGFDALCMEALDAAYHIEERGHVRLKGAIKPLKEWLLGDMTEDNKRDLSWCLVLLDLIEKSPVK
ncbi:hypothetical protein GM415_05690 [Pseudodesulfovibrio cashew]|uniref:Uncharacterized protein n=2 Tax=Pseudodesulfovibrio cashew TaxID=2678688 RepID=A0A6I6JGL2_9BACT|nr:hypothetical protein GM415_05690 [Pseudodesulfovibrio cashew]